MPSKYVDTNAIIQVIGCIYNTPQLLDQEDKYNITEEDFPETFHQILFGSIYRVYHLGAKEISLLSIEDYLKGRPKSEAIFRQRKGEEWLLKAAENSTLSTFDYYYNRLKKMTLLRLFDDVGINVSDIYDPDNILDVKKKQAQEEYLDNSSLLDIADLVSAKVDTIRTQFVDETYGRSAQAGEGIFDLIENLKLYPEFGIGLFGDYMNTVTRGARLSKFYLRSAASGYGKSRTMAADAAFIACDEIYYENTGWVSTGEKHPTLFITTELTLDEVQTLFLCFLSGVNEEHILNGYYVNDEEERVMKAAQMIADSPLYVEEMMDFSLQDVENIVKKNIREHGVKYIFLDYIHSSLKILEEISSKTKGMKLREDNVLFMMSNKMKNICNQYNVFIMSATQLSGDWRESETPDQQLLRGSKAIADKIDWGSHLLPVMQKDIDSLQEVLSRGGYQTPDMKLSIYKNRRGKYKGVYLWCKADLGTCRITPMFATRWDYTFLEMENVQISNDE